MQNSRGMSCSLHIFWIFLAKVKLCQVSSVKVMLTDFRKGRRGGRGGAFWLLTFLGKPKRPILNSVKKDPLTQVFPVSSEFCEIFRNTFLWNTSGGCYLVVSPRIVSKVLFVLELLSMLGSKYKYGRSINITEKASTGRSTFITPEANGSLMKHNLNQILFWICEQIKSIPSFVGIFQLQVKAWCSLVMCSKVIKYHTIVITGEIELQTFSHTI